MAGKIFILQDGGQLIEMNESEYDSEDLLQSLLVQYTDLLAGEQIDSKAPRSWLLISREMPVPAKEGGGGQWSLDHLFLDQDAVPTIVEVKRSSDTRIRREVVGQILDYAANAVVYWPLEEIRVRFEASQENPSEALAGLLGEEANEEEFWQKAKTNLQAGRVRLVFVADLIPPELQRIVEFLNEQMDPAEVLAVEIKQYVGENMKTLVPRVIGQTAEAKRRKTGGAREKREWDRASFLRDLNERKGLEFEELAKHLMDWIEDKRLRIWWGEGMIDGSLYAMLDHKGKAYWTFSLWTNGYVQVPFDLLRKHCGIFAEEGKRRELQGRLNLINGVSIEDEALSRYPSFPMAALLDESSLSQFTETFEWYIEEIRRMT